MFEIREPRRDLKVCFDLHQGVVSYGEVIEKFLRMASALSLSYIGWN